MKLIDEYNSSERVYEHLYCNVYNYEKFAHDKIDIFIEQLIKYYLNPSDDLKQKIEIQYNKYIIFYVLKDKRNVNKVIDLYKKHCRCSMDDYKYALFDMCIDMNSEKVKHIEQYLNEHIDELLTNIIFNNYKLYEYYELF